MSRQAQIWNVTLWGSVVNAALAAFKLLAGIAGHSSAMVADAAHSLSDFATDIIVLFFVRLADKPGDEDHEYGHGKYETFASLLIGIALVLVGLGIFLDGCQSIVSFIEGIKLEAPNGFALAAAIISIVLKEGLYRYTMANAKRLDSPVLAVNAWHHRSDALSSIAALIGISGAMILGPSWQVLDPVAALVVSFMVLKMAWDLMKPNFEELMEKSLTEQEKERIKKIISGTNGVQGFHHLRTRRIGAYCAIDAHVKMNASITLLQAHDIATEIEQSLKDEFGRQTYVSIHMEPLQ